MRSYVALALVSVIVLASSPAALADIICPDSSYVTVTLGPQARNRLTIDPHPGGETWASKGITIDVYLKNCNGAPLAGVPRQEVVMYNPALCLCPGGNVADAATDLNGRTSFSGALEGGGCVEELLVIADGILIGRTGLKTNSPDAVPASPCFVDHSDLAALASRLGCPGPNCPTAYTICGDLNEDGFIDASDGSHFGFFLGSNFCQ